MFAPLCCSSTSVEFAAAVPCTLEVHVRCRESQEAGCVAFQRLDAAGPPSVAQALGPGTHTAVLSEEAVNLVRWPLHRYWKYSKQEPDVVPVALSLRCADGTQSILHAFLDPVTTEEMQSDGSGLRAAIRMHKVVVQGAEYLVEEIYGIAEVGRESAHDESGVGEPCVICLSEPRTTALLPCRHLSTCEECAKQLKVRADRCPICRAEVKGLQAFDMK
ncbi:unnamed protein product [Prorocentrum cordatum]|uniref:RING-type domain-containing protein n=1 Tax=Prorocentrum cordatum TaxID=2364126 RepID=A0ABN9VC47_9DINO|nr:unnamed protein product [Polarella glacialis]